MALCKIRREACGFLLYCASDWHREGAEGMAREGKGVKGAVDRVGGKIVYRAVSLAFLLMAVLSLNGAWWALSDGGNSLWPGLIMLVAGLACLWACAGAGLPSGD